MMKVYSKLDDDTREKLKTERQWAKLGYVPINNEVGVQLWSNQYCSNSYRYLSEKEVRKATKEELNKFFEPERKKRNEKAKILRAKMKKSRQYEQLFKDCKNAIKSTKFEDLCHVKTAKRIVLDLETTGLNMETDEILQISIIDDDGNVLLDSYVNPIIHKEWEQAEKIHGISLETVRNAPTIIELLPQINYIIEKAAEIIGYNIANFDLQFLINLGIDFSSKIVDDIMFPFAEIYGEWNDYFEGWKWQKLTTCASFYKYNWGNDEAHNSLSDCRATLYCYNMLHNNN